MREFRAQLEEVACDESLSGGDRVHRLCELRADLSRVLGVLDTYLVEAELERDAERPPDDVQVARENATIGEELIRRGMATAVELEESGWLSHDALDVAAEAGRLEEVARGAIGRAWGLGLLKGTTFNRNVRRGRGGKFIARPGGPGPKVPGARLRAGRPSAPAAPEPRTAELPRARPEAAPDQPQLDQAEQAALDEWPPRRGEVARRILGDDADTQTKYSVEEDGRRIYTAERKKLHDEIVQHFLGDARPSEGRHRALFMAGGAASGKSSALKTNADMVPDGAVMIDPDAIKGMLPEYREMVESRDRYAAFGAHEESGDIAKRLHAEAMAQGLDLVVDGTGNSGPGKFVAKIERVLGAGYDTDVLYVTVPTEVAVERAMLRAARSGRYVPERVIRDAHAAVSRNALDVLRIEGLGNVTVVDNRGSGPQAIYRRQGGRLLTMDRGLYDEFIAKGHE